MNSAKVRIARCDSCGHYFNYAELFSEITSDGKTLWFCDNCLIDMELKEKLATIRKEGEEKATASLPRFKVISGDAEKVERELNELSRPIKRMEVAYTLFPEFNSVAQTIIAKPAFGIVVEFEEYDSGG